MKTTISTTIPIEIYEEAKKRHFKWNDLLITGFQARIDSPKWQERQRDTEEKVIKLAQKVTELTQKNWELLEKIQKIGEKNDKTTNT